MYQVYVGELASVVAVNRIGADVPQFVFPKVIDCAIPAVGVGAKVTKVGVLVAEHPEAAVPITV